MAELRALLLVATQVAAQAQETFAGKLAELSGMHRNQISNLERNVSREPKSSADPHLSTVYELARALGVAPDLLLPDLGRVPPLKSPESRDTSSFSVVEETLAAALTEERRRG